MNFRKRLKTYLIGFTIGIVIVAALFGPRAFSCSYFPNARTFEEAKSKPLQFTPQAMSVIQSEDLDSAFVFNELLKNSKITNFGTDEVRINTKLPEFKDSCRTYHAVYEGKENQKSYRFAFKIYNEKTVFTEIEKE